jgi:putative hydrolase of the HAD superfamily
MAIKAVFFDAAGTLIKPARRVGESYARLADKYGLHVAPSELTERFLCCFNAAPPLAFPGANLAHLSALEREWWRNLVLCVFEPWGRFERFDDYFAELFEYFAGAAAWQLYPEVVPTLSALKRRGLVLDVISNFDSRLRRILTGLGVGECFDEVFVSSAVGHAKPDRRIFQAALRKHGLTPGQAAHVGDSVTKDIRGAADAGLTAILIDRGAQPSLPGLSRVSSLDEIFSVLID